MIITFIGPDGSGKTSIRKMVSSMLRERYPDLAVKEYERRFRVLPTITRLLGRVPAKQDPDTINEHVVYNKHPLKSVLIVSYYTLEYFICKIKLALDAKSEQNTVHLFARYFHDYYFGFEHARLPAWVLRVLEVFVPRPDLVLFLYRPPETIRDDKPELPIAEIRRQQKAIETSKFAKRREFRWIRATSDLESTAQLVFAEVRDCIERRVGACAAPQVAPLGTKGH